MNKTRLVHLQKELKQRNLDGIVLMPGPNMVYLTGIHSHVSERPMLLFVPAESPPAIIIPTLEAMKAENAGISPSHIFAWNDQDGYTNAFQQASQTLKLKHKKWGVEALHMRVLEHDLLAEFAPSLHTTHADVVMTALRIKKDPDEIAAMQRAIVIAEKAMEKLLPQIKLGQTEKQIAGILSQLLVEGGADSIAFGPAVQAGPNAASPHGVPTDRSIKRGDVLLIDWGCYVDNYPSDITRTFAIGELGAEMKRVYEVVLAANNAGRVIAKPGVMGQQVDEAARQVIAAAGYGDYFIHRTGHGLGLEIHEPPDMVAGNLEPLRPGNVFTVEPGIYLPGKGGVRIEDDMVITEAGCRSLTTFPRELKTILLEQI